jgi:hypothetical protein
MAGWLNGSMAHWLNGSMAIGKWPLAIDHWQLAVGY